MSAIEAGFRSARTPAKINLYNLGNRERAGWHSGRPPNCTVQSGTLSLIEVELINGARGRNRTGTIAMIEGFSYQLQLSLRVQCTLCGLDFLFTITKIYNLVLGGSRQVSTLSMEGIVKLHKYSESELKAAVSSSASLRQTLLALGVSPYGGNYTVLKKAINHFKLDVSHFHGRAWNRGKKLPKRRATQEYLSNQQPIQSYKLKKRLLNEGYLKPACAGCERTLWLGRPIPLELDHVDGNRKNNSLNNLRLLCPNCHALTPTYRSKNRSKA